MKPTVLLFDIDGTLITTGGVGRKALERAFGVLHGRPDACASFSFAGMTDPAIIRRGLLAANVAVSNEAMEAVCAKYLEYLHAEVGAADDASYRVHRGMREAVQAGLESGAAVGLGTGNVRAGAVAKLRRVGLDQHFRFGGFGDDHEERPALIRVGIERGAALLGAPPGELRVVVIGDTPKDVDAARANGALSLGVATGGFTVDQLLAAGATWAVGDLTAPGALQTLLGK